jgi:glutamine synthetase
MRDAPTKIPASRQRERQIRAILGKCRAAKTHLVRFLYCGNDSVIRGKACHTRFLPSYLESGIGMTVAMGSFNMLDQLVPEGSFGPAGEIRLSPDLETFAVLPYSPNSARFLCDMTTLGGQPWDVCARSFLKRMIERASCAGVALKAAFENEFTLARREGDHCPDG